MWDEGCVGAAFDAAAGEAGDCGDRAGSGLSAGCQEEGRWWAVDRRRVGWGEDSVGCARGGGDGRARWLVAKAYSLTPEADDFDTPAGQRVDVAFLFRDGQRVQEVQVAAGPRGSVALVNGRRTGCGDKDPGKSGREDGSDEHDGVRPSACD